MGLVIASGLSIGTLFTLFVVPAFYLPAQPPRPDSASARCGARLGLTESRAMFAGFERDTTFLLREGSRTLPCAFALVAAPLAALEATAQDMLSPEEAALLTDRLAPIRRQSFLAGRRAAKIALGLLAPGVPGRRHQRAAGPVATARGLRAGQVEFAGHAGACRHRGHRRGAPRGVPDGGRPGTCRSGAAIRIK